MKKMMFTVLSVFTLSGSLAHANPGEWLQCTTPGDALEAVDLAINNGGRPETVTVLMSVSDAAGSSFSGTSSMNAKDFDAMMKSSDYHLVFKSRESTEFGGAVSKAALLTLNDNNNKISGILSFSGAVFTLNCKPVVAK